MIKKLLNMLFGKKETEIKNPAPVISIHDDIKKTIEEIKERIVEPVLETEPPKMKKVQTSKEEKPKKAKKAPAKKKTVTKIEAPKEKAKKGPKKTK